MGRLPCCDEVGVKKGPWTSSEDKLLVDYIEKNDLGSWRNLPKKAGLNRCGKSCRLRWTNYLRPDIKRGKFSEDEERIIIHLHSVLGNKWSTIATRLQGRTDNEIKNYWNTRIKKKLLLMGIDPVTHRPQTNLDLYSSLPNLLAAANKFGNLDNALRIQADATHMAKAQIMQSLIQLLMASNSSPTMDAINLLASSLSFGNNHHQIGANISKDLNPMAQLNLPNILGNSQNFDTFQTTTMGNMNNPVMNSYATNNNISKVSTPSFVSASPENNASTDDQLMNDRVHSHDVSPNSSASTHFEAWDDDLCWKDILEQSTWSL